MKPINIIRGQNAESFNVKAVGVSNITDFL
jgi:hypothetical protein